MHWYVGSRLILSCRLCNVAYVDLHSNLSLEHGGCRGGASLIVEPEGQWRKHTMLKIGNLKESTQYRLVSRYCHHILIKDNITVSSMSELLKISL